MSKNNLKRFINKIFYRPVIKISGGGGNLIAIPDSVSARRVSIEIYGSNNKIIVGEGAYLHNTRIRVGFSNCPVENCIVKIGDSTSFNEVLIQLGESDSVVEVGSGCMCSHGIELNCTDHHTIFNADGEVINVGKSIKIGSKVWICKNVKVMKNTNVPDGCVLAQNSIITKNFTQENCIIAGNPGRVVKENIRWDRLRPQNALRGLKANP